MSRASRSLTALRVLGPVQAMEDRPAGIRRCERRHRGGPRATRADRSEWTRPDAERQAAASRLPAASARPSPTSPRLRRRSEDRLCRRRRRMQLPMSTPGRCGSRHRYCLMTPACWVASSAAGAEARARTWPAGAAARRNTLIHRAAIPIDGPEHCPAHAAHTDSRHPLIASHFLKANDTNFRVPPSIPK